MEIVSSGVVCSVTLGKDDPSVSPTDFVYNGSVSLTNEQKTAIASYNRALTTLNEKAATYKDENGIAQKARCTGTPENATGFFDRATSSNASKNQYIETLGFNNKFRAGKYSKDDYTQMEKLNINNISVEYWYSSSRVNDYNQYDTYFDVAYVVSSGAWNWPFVSIIDLNSNGTIWMSGGSKGIRIVFTLNPNVMVTQDSNHDGTSAETAYELSL